MVQKPYNPLDKLRLGQSVAKALLSRPVTPLPPYEAFVGAGIYALYYTGAFAAYKQIAEKNSDGQWAAPIYVGKAVPAGARKGGYGLDEAPGEVLYQRLREHAESIEQVSNLRLCDFSCRYLVVDDIWIPLGESLRVAAGHHVFSALESAARRFRQPRPRKGPLQPTTISLGHHPPRSAMGSETAAWSASAGQSSC